ncbi:hypothetical protein QFZ87_001511 [Bacillus sp. SLBN-46]|uniref:hypothetical protein n=1 Tax=Bacillus sp. SLBN-46 TaxID=3042283 RepID=UPI002863EF3E|nr:hypothetical protein [Bacillus sp. SLBN-46]MDR6121914.1 hypothetical protein [Bacillus sp. SLBN-46]
MKEGQCMRFIGDLNINRKIAWVHVDYDVFHWTKGEFKKGEELEYMKKFNHVICVSNKVKQSVINQAGDTGNLIYIANPLMKRKL